MAPKDLRTLKHTQVGVVDKDRQVRVQVTPTITAGAYSADDALGELMTFAGMARYVGGAGVIITAILFCKDQTLQPDVDIYIWNETITGDADNDAMTITDADMLKGGLVIPILVSDWKALATNGSAHVNAEVPFRCAEGSDDIFVQMVLRTATTYGATDELTLTLTAETD